MSIFVRIIQLRMKTVYANSAHPKLVKWSCVIAFIVGLGLYILYMTLEGDAKYLLYLAGFSLMYSPLFLGQYYLRRYEHLVFLGEKL